MTQTGSPVPPLTLRPLSVADAAALQAVYAASEDYFLRASAAPPQAADELREAADEEGRFLLGIYLSGEMIGVLDVRLAYPEPFDVAIGFILLAAAQRRQGLGSWALRLLETWLARDTPTEAVLLQVPATDHAAQAFFRANDYTFTGQSTRVLAGDLRVRLLEMRKNLSSQQL